MLRWNFLVLLRNLYHIEKINGGVLHPVSPASVKIASAFLILWMISCCREMQWVIESPKVSSLVVQCSAFLNVKCRNHFFKIKSYVENYNMKPTLSRSTIVLVQVFLFKSWHEEKGTVLNCYPNFVAKWETIGSVNVKYFLGRIDNINI